MAGYGPIPADMARRIAQDAELRRIVTDPIDRSVLDYGRTTYRPPKALRDHIRARDRRCRFPGCGQPAARCDLDHTIPYPKGPTAAGNLGLLCRHHHRLKQSPGWTLLQRHGHFYWISPTGKTYPVDPEDYDTG